MTNHARTQKHASDYDCIAEAIRFLDSHASEQPSLQALAAHLGLSPSYTQRLFTRWAGVSPKQFVKLVTHAHAVELLRDHENVLTTALHVGLSGPGRLHDLCVTVDAMSPGEIGAKGAGVDMAYGFHDTPFGTGLLVVSKRGLVGLAFADDAQTQDMLDDMTARWPKARFVHDQKQTRTYHSKIFEQLSGDLPLSLAGTPFQVKVWQALLRIPQGQAVTYSDIAQYIGAPKAVRAVGSAVGRNPISYVIPCHRVLRKSGALGGYHWGETRKKALLAYESAHALEPA